ncbi:MAG TPA: STAS domain-containing protein [Vicinamibacterales bacterium]|nr:STAS domain-containing protein [Vicinamibacterales bacterium]
MTNGATNNRGGGRWTLTVTAGRLADVLVLRTAGRLPAAAAPRMAAALADAIGAGERDVIVDLEGLDYISSAGILAIEAAAARLHMEGGRLRLASPLPPVRLALELAGFPADVEILPSL